MGSLTKEDRGTFERRLAYARKELNSKELFSFRPSAEADQKPITLSALHAAWAAHIQDLRAKGRPVRMNMYIHIPFCPSKCRYCMYESVPGRPQKEHAAYVRYLIGYLSYFQDVFKGVNFTHLYIGGGTPTILSEPLLAELLHAIFSRFRFTADGSRTIEISPTTASAGKLRTIRRSGINRISMGIQSFSKRTLEHYGRAYTPPDTIGHIIRTAQGHPVQEFTVDLIAGLHKETPEQIISHVQKAFALAPDKVCIYTINKYKQNAFFYSSYPAFLRTASALQNKIRICAKKNGYLIVHQSTDSIVLRNALSQPSFTSVYEFHSCNGSSTFGIGHFAKGHMFGRMQYRNIPGATTWGPERESAHVFPMDHLTEKAAFLMRHLENGSFSSREYREVFGEAPERSFAKALSFLRTKKLLHFAPDTRSYVWRKGLGIKDRIVYSSVFLEHKNNSCSGNGPGFTHFIMNVRKALRTAKVPLRLLDHKTVKNGIEVTFKHAQAPRPAVLQFSASPSPCFARTKSGLYCIYQSGPVCHEEDVSFKALVQLL